MSSYKVPTSSSLMVHDITEMRAIATPDNNGALSLDAWDGDGWSTFGITIFTGGADLSADLAEAINAVLVKHNRLRDQIKAVAA
jgi:hypothetical protein